MRHDKRFDGAVREQREDCEGFHATVEYDSNEGNWLGDIRGELQSLQENITI